MPWVSPAIRVKYGPYFKADPTEELQIIQMVQAALGVGKVPGVPIITRRMAVEKASQIFSIDNIDALVDAIDEEQAEKHKLDQEKMVESAKAMAEVAPKEPSAPPAKKPTE